MYDSSIRNKMLNLWIWVICNKEKHNPPPETSDCVHSLLLNQTLFIAGLFRDTITFFISGFMHMWSMQRLDAQQVVILFLVCDDNKNSVLLLNQPVQYWSKLLFSPQPSQRHYLFVLDIGDGCDSFFCLKFFSTFGSLIFAFNWAFVWYPARSRLPF